MATYIRTSKFTDWGGRGPFRDVAQWLIEFPDDDYPMREIGLNVDGKPVHADGDETHAYWNDIDVELSFFDDAEEITEESFEELWNLFFATHPTNARGNLRWWVWAIVIGIAYAIIIRLPI